MLYFYAAQRVSVQLGAGMPNGHLNKSQDEQHFPVVLIINKVHKVESEQILKM